MLRTRLETLVGQNHQELTYNLTESEETFTIRLNLTYCQDKKIWLVSVGLRETECLCRLFVHLK